MTKILLCCALLSGLSPARVFAMEEEAKNMRDEVYILAPEPENLSPEDINTYLDNQQREYSFGFDKRRIEEEERLKKIQMTRSKPVKTISDRTTFSLTAKVPQEGDASSSVPVVVLLNLSAYYADSFAFPLAQPLLKHNLGQCITDCDLTRNKLHILPLYLLCREWPHLKNISVRNGEITFIEAIDPYDRNSFLEKNRALKKVDLRLNNLGDTAKIESIITLLEYYEGLQDLNLKQNRFTVGRQGLMLGYASGLFSMGKNYRRDDEFSEKGTRKSIFANDNRTLKIKLSLATT
jgi:hypothetical protein